MINFVLNPKIVPGKPITIYLRNDEGETLKEIVGEYVSYDRQNEAVTVKYNDKTETIYIFDMFDFGAEDDTEELYVSCNIEAMVNPDFGFCFCFECWKEIPKDECGDEDRCERYCDSCGEMTGSMEDSKDRWKKRMEIYHSLDHRVDGKKIDEPSIPIHLDIKDDDGISVDTVSVNVPQETVVEIIRRVVELVDMAEEKGFDHYQTQSTFMDLKAILSEHNMV